MTRATTTPEPDRAALAAFLTSVRRASGLTWDQLARATTPSARALRRTASAAGLVPPEDNVIGFVRGCGYGEAEQRRARDLWRAARIEERGVLPRLKASRVEYVRNPGDLLDAAAAAYERDGAPPLRTVQERGGRSVLSVRAVRAIVLPVGKEREEVRRYRQLPGDVRQFEAFLRGCRVEEKELPAWLEAWHRVTGPPGSRDPVPAPARRGQAEDQAARAAACKISPRFEKLLKRLSAEEVETILTAGTAYLAAEEAQRNGSTLPAAVNGILALSLLGGNEGRLSSEELARFPAWTPHHRPAALPDSGVDIVYPAGDGRVMVAEVKRYGGPGRPDADVAPVPLPSGPGSGSQPSRACRLPVPDSPTAAGPRTQPGHALTARPAEVAQRRGG